MTTGIITGVSRPLKTVGTRQDSGQTDGLQLLPASPHHASSDSLWGPVALANASWPFPHTLDAWTSPATSICSGPLNFNFQFACWFFFLSFFFFFPLRLPSLYNLAFLIWVAYLEILLCLKSESESKVLVAQSLPGCSVHGIFQARILKWIAIPFSRGFSQPKWGIKLGSPTLEADSLPSEPLCLSFLNPCGWSLEPWDLGYLVLAVSLESMVIWQTMTEVKLKIKTAQNPPLGRG